MTYVSLPSNETVESKDYNRVTIDAHSVTSSSLTRQSYLLGSSDAPAIHIQLVRIKYPLYASPARTRVRIEATL
jgi:hypothetical protein